MIVTFNRITYLDLSFNLWAIDWYDSRTLSVAFGSPLPEPPARRRRSWYWLFTHESHLSRRFDEHAAWIIGRLVSVYWAKRRSG
jgi:hypothetical protein